MDQEQSEPSDPSSPEIEDFEHAHHRATAGRESSLLGLFPENTRKFPRIDSWSDVPTFCHIEDITAGCVMHSHPSDPRLARYYDQLNSPEEADDDQNVDGISEEREGAENIDNEVKVEDEDEDSMPLEMASRKSRTIAVHIESTPSKRAKDEDALLPSVAPTTTVIPPTPNA